MFNSLNLLPGDHFNEAKASDLITGYTGQAGKCTRELLKKSLGGVLFIDEAYQMDPARGGVYMTEASDELVGALTEEEFKGKVLVILAGYEEDMERMLKTNPGLKSRFSERIHFNDFDDATVVELLVSELEKAGIPLESKDEGALMKLAKRLIDESGNSFGNGRDVVTRANSVYKVVAKAFTQQSGLAKQRKTNYSSTLADVKVALEQLLISRRERRGGQTCKVVERDGNSFEATAKKHQGPPPLVKTLQTTKAIATEEEQVVENEHTVEEAAEAIEEPSNMFGSISSNVLKTLQNAIDDMNLGSEEGAKHLASISRSSKEFNELVCRLEKETGMNSKDAKANILKWQSLQEDLEATIEKEKQKTKTLGAQPIWRCAVCGAADKPWIACYVAPFIVRYEKVPS